MRRRELVAGIGSLGVLAGGAGIVTGGLRLPSFETDGAASAGDGGTDGPIEVETIDARGSEAGTTTVPGDAVAVVTFFVTGCGNCQAQIPRLADARSRLVGDANDPTFLSVTYQSSEDVPDDELSDWWRTHGGNWSVGYDSESDLAATYGAVGYPVTVVVDERGEKRWDYVGIASADELVDGVEPVLESDDENASAETDGSESDES